MSPARAHKDGVATSPSSATPHMPWAHTAVGCATQAISVHAASPQAAVALAWTSAAKSRWTPATRPPLQ